MPTNAPAAVTPVLSARRVPELIADTVADRRIAERLRDFMQTVPAASCLIVSANGKRLFAANPDTPVSPASIEKIVTAKAALGILGPDSALTTRVAAASPPSNGVVRGDLWMIGGGDERLGTADWALHFKHQPQAYSEISLLADRVVAAGVREVQGRVIGDDSRYDRVRYLPQWPTRFATADEIGPMSALSLNGGLTAFPTSPRVSTPRDTPAADPAQAAAEVFRKLLIDRGVTISGDAGSGTAPGSVSDVATLDSVPVAQLVAHMLLESDNGTAEALTKEMGFRVSGNGTLADGQAAVQNYLQQQGVSVDGRTTVDGSGLAVEDKETCSRVQGILESEGPNSLVGNALPVAGQTGTLDTRFKRTPLEGKLRAKTGTLDNVTALAGFVPSAAGAPITFTFIINTPPAQKITDDDVDLETTMATIVDGYPDAPDVAALSPMR
jgi:D-alanyl-D-alanine carboxypeptidase/D-alanyl-D-alanine-endopeptidase (penicillin-binding protein 4)